jgi:hypothetical protein
MLLWKIAIVIAIGPNLVGRRDVKLGPRGRLGFLTILSYGTISTGLTKVTCGAG